MPDYVTLAFEVYLFRLICFNNHVVLNLLNLLKPTINIFTRFLQNSCTQNKPK